MSDILLNDLADKTPLNLHRRIEDSDSVRRLIQGYNVTELAGGEDKGERHIDAVEADVVVGRILSAWIRSGKTV